MTAGFSFQFSADVKTQNSEQTWFFEGVSMQIFFHNSAILLFSEIVIFMIDSVCDHTCEKQIGSAARSSDFAITLMKADRLDSTQSHYHYL